MQDPVSIRGFTVSGPQIALCSHQQRVDISKHSTSNVFVCISVYTFEFKTNSAKARLTPHSARNAVMNTYSCFWPQKSAIL